MTYLWKVVKSKLFSGVAVCCTDFCVMFYRMYTPKHHAKPFHVTTSFQVVKQVLMQLCCNTRCGFGQCVQHFVLLAVFCKVGALQYIASTVTSSDSRSPGSFTWGSVLPGTYLSDPHSISNSLWCPVSRFVWYFMYGLVIIP